MPWTPAQFASRHNHGITGPEAIHAAHIANAMLKSGADEGLAIATANKRAERAPGGGILGGGIDSVSTPNLQNFTQSPPGMGNTNALALANTHLAQRPVPSSFSASPPAPALDAGGMVDPNQGVGGVSPSTTAGNPMVKGLVQRYATLPTEKLTELSAALKGSPQGQIINSLLSQRRSQPNAQSAAPTPLASSLQPNPTVSTGTPIAVASGGAIKKRAAGAGIAVRVPSGEVLFLKRGKGGDYPGTWCFPGGGIEEKETPEQAARREFREETGHEISGKLPALHHAPNGYTTFGAEIPATFKPRINGEHTGYVWAHPNNPPRPLHPGVKASLDKAARANGGAMPRRADGGSSPTNGEPPDFTSRYNTRLSPHEESQYQAWAQKIGRSNDTFDYDMRGAWKGGVSQAENGHFPDTYKKPNHPTFSNESQYNGVDGFQGGQWSDQGYKPSSTNLQMYGPSGLRDYFEKVEPDTPLVIPQSDERRSGGRLARRDLGGGMSLGTLDPSWTRQDWRQAGDVSTGFLGGSSLGRADSIKTRAPAGSYILPADVVSGLGEGNSLAGSRVFDEILRSMPYGTQGSQQKGGRGAPRAPSLSLSVSKGGEVKDGPDAEPVDVLLSDGERVVLPHHVRMWGDIAAQHIAKKRGGSPDRWDKLKLGHRALDAFVLNERAKHIKKLKSLPGPVQPKDKAA